MSTDTATKALTRADLKPDQDVKWCPGCGDYAILAQVQKTLPDLGIPREKLVFISGIGCSSRFPYYMNTFGMHTIHGRAPAIATGLKLSRPDLSVWIVTGDGDGLSIGGNHLIHTIRRNLDVQILLFNNQIYGLTKGQASPTSEFGKRTKSSPLGTIEQPFKPLNLMLGAGATFVARSLDRDPPHLTSMLRRAADHRGTSFLEVYQNCNIFNDGAFLALTDKKRRASNRLMLEHGKPLVFGPNNEFGIVFDGATPQVVDVETVGLDNVQHHDEQGDLAYHFALSRMGGDGLPTPIGVIRAMPVPSMDALLDAQLSQAEAKMGPGKLDALLRGTDTWEVS